MFREVTCKKTVYQKPTKSGLRIKMLFTMYIENTVQFIDSNKYQNREGYPYFTERDSHCITNLEMKLNEHLCLLPYLRGS